jgi:hypothetical protein
MITFDMMFVIDTKMRNLLQGHEHADDPAEIPTMLVGYRL